MIAEGDALPQATPITKAEVIRNFPKINTRTTPKIELLCMAKVYSGITLDKTLTKTQIVEAMLQRELSRAI